MWIFITVDEVKRTYIGSSSDGNRLYLLPEKWLHNRIIAVTPQVHTGKRSYKKTVSWTKKIYICTLKGSNMVKENHSLKNYSTEV